MVFKYKLSVRKISISFFIESHKLLNIFKLDTSRLVRLQNNFLIIIILMVHKYIFLLFIVNQK